MDYLKLRFYLELLHVCFGITYILVYIPLRIIAEGELKPLSLVIGFITWTTILLYNRTFYILVDKWFRK